jgi:glycogen debranching enzyme
VVNGVPDGSIRPNQVFAISLHHPLVTGERAKQILDVVEHELLTPYGLRTLSPRDARYCGKYEGDMRQRDAAYHQGTVWPWLLGPFVSAYVKVHGRSKAVQHKLLSWLEPLQQHLHEAGIGQISEVFDGDAPHRPGGCFAQAWSVAEILRTLCEDVHAVKPVKRATPAPRKLRLIKRQTAVSAS